jgi:hypothetical protein
MHTAAKSGLAIHGPAGSGRGSSSATPMSLFKFSPLALHRVDSRRIKPASPRSTVVSSSDCSRVIFFNITFVVFCPFSRTTCIPVQLARVRDGRSAPSYGTLCSAKTRAQCRRFWHNSSTTAAQVYFPVLSGHTYSLVPSD